MLQEKVDDGGLRVARWVEHLETMIGTNIDWKFRVASVSSKGASIDMSLEDRPPLKPPFDPHPIYTSHFAQVLNPLAGHASNGQLLELIFNDSLRRSQVTDWKWNHPARIRARVKDIDFSDGYTELNDLVGKFPVVIIQLENVRLVFDDGSEVGITATE